MKLIGRIMNRLSGQTKHWDRILEGVRYKFDTDINDCAPADAVPALSLIAALTASWLDRCVGPNATIRVVDAPARSMTVYQLEEAFHYTSMIVAGSFAASQTTRGLSSTRFLKLVQRSFGTSTLGARLYAEFSRPSSVEDVHSQLAAWSTQLNAAFGIERVDWLEVVQAQMSGLAHVASIINACRTNPIALPFSCIVDCTADEEDVEDERDVEDDDGEMLDDEPNEPALKHVDPALEAVRNARWSAEHLDRSGRNVLCPCGSGQKLKHCCGKVT